MIKATNLVRKYGDFTAVNSVSFEIPKGEIVGLLGHNGAGKTTIMKMLTGYLEPTGGQVEVDSQDIISDRLSIQKKIGYLPETTPVYPEMIVIDYLDYVGRLRGVEEENLVEAVAKAINRTGLKEKAVEPISTLSKGYRQRVGIAQAIIHDPEFLILDEPTSGLDPSQINEIRELIIELSQNSTVILSTHILQEVEALCDRAIIIVRGKIALDSKLEDLRKSNRLHLAVDAAPKDTEESLKGVNGIEKVNFLREQEGCYEYLLEVKQNGSPLTPDVANALVGKGMKLYALQPEVRGLESVFREVNSGEQK